MNKALSSQLDLKIHAGLPGAPEPVRQSEPGVRLLCWSVHPMRTEPWYRSVLLGSVVSGVSIYVAVSFGSLVLGSASLLMLGVAVSRYWAATHFRLDASGVHTRHLGWSRMRPWSAFRHVAVGCVGVCLGPLVKPSRLDSFRGVMLPCRGEDLAAVRAMADEYVQTATR